MSSISRPLGLHLSFLHGQFSFLHCLDGNFLEKLCSDEFFVLGFKDNQKIKGLSRFGVIVFLGKRKLRTF